MYASLYNLILRKTDPTMLNGSSRWCIYMHSKVKVDDLIAQKTNILRNILEQDIKLRTT